MRKKQRQEILEILKILEAAHEAVKHAAEKGCVAEAREMLAECQQAAVAAGTCIEQSEGEGQAAVRILEEYCETLFRIHEELGEGGFSSDKAYRILGELLVKAEKLIQNDIPVKKEVVFLPYKASMWDSLESVWRAAEDDSDYDVYVVPIPYYDKNPDGSFGKMHYEGSQYPAYVQIIHYDDYDLERREPDIVFIHNPYDECNYVTSVSPRYYSKNLRHYADKLIYIPYFVLGEGMYESMCVTPGTLLSDHVIAHSENAKNDYIKYLKECYVQNAVMKAEEAENMLRRKILPLGSPKIDKVINGKREDYKLPEEWKKLLEGKKAVLYNTGVSGILNGNAQELKKIKDTIAFFAGRDDVVLWWRPHPLIGATVQSMRNHLLSEYLEIIAEYKSSGVGIFDDTADLHRAVLWTDMYYGDDSSVIYLYGVQGKPVVMQNIHCLSVDAADRTDAGIRYRISCQAEESVYFFAWEYNRLYRLDPSNGLITAVADAPHEQQMEPSLYSGMFYDKRLLWLVPSRAHALAAYHLDTGEWEQYELPDRIKSSTRIEDTIYMLSSDYGCLWCMDLQERKLEKKEICYRQKEKLRISNEYYNSDLYLKDGKIYYLITHTNILAVYDPKCGQAKLLHIGAETNRYQRMAYDGSCFYLLPNNKSGVVRWDGKTVQESDAGSYPKEFSAPFGFLNFAFIDHDIWLFPYSGNRILCMDKHTMQITQSLEVDRIFHTEMVDMGNVTLLPDGRIVISASNRGTDDSIALIDAGLQTVSQYPAACQDENPIAYGRIFARLEKEKYTSAYAYRISEGSTYTLGRVCDALAKSEHTYPAMENCFRSLYAYSDGTAGVHIWEEIKEC